MKSGVLTRDNRSSRLSHCDRCVRSVIRILNTRILVVSSSDGTGSLAKGFRLRESDNEFEGFELISRYTSDCATGRDKIDRGHRGPIDSFGISPWRAPTPSAAGAEISVGGLGLGESNLRRH